MQEEIGLKCYHEMKQIYLLTRKHELLEASRTSLPKPLSGEFSHAYKILSHGEQLFSICTGMDLSAGAGLLPELSQ